MIPRLMRKKLTLLVKLTNQLVVREFVGKIFSYNWLPFSETAQGFFLTHSSTMGLAYW